MEFQTKIPLKKQEENLIDYNSKLLLLGSCFSENIGEKFDYFKFQSLSNPFGVLFHPKAIETLVEKALNLKNYTEDDVFLNNEQFHCYDAHSKLSNVSKKEILNDLNNGLEKTNKEIHESTHIIITIGTAWVYKLLETNKVVANCHKVSQSNFKKELLSVDVIVTALQSIISKIKAVNPDATLLFTVSPVRHIKDGFTENTLSKSHLITAIHSVLYLRAQSSDLSYFPSYEIMMDELRDYRFYKTDMLHPNDTAIQYIWERFKSIWIDESVEKIMDKVTAIQSGLAHRPFNENSNAHQQFLEQLSLKQAKLKQNFPSINFD